MSSKRNLSVRMALEGVEKVQEGFKKLGQDGQKALNDIEEASEPASKSLKNLDGASRTVQTSLKAMAGVAAAAGVAFSLKNAIQFGVELDSLAKRMGSTTEALSQLKFAAETNNVSFDALTGSMENMLQKVSEAATGTGTAKDAIKELGLSAERLVELRPEQMLEAFADGLADVGNSSDKSRLAVELFGGQGAALLPIMQDGAAGIREMRMEADQMGATLDTIAAENMVEAQREWTKLTAASGALANVIGIEVLPALSGFVQGINDLIRGSEVQNQLLLEMGALAVGLGHSLFLVSKEQYLSVLETKKAIEADKEAVEQRKVDIDAWEKKSEALGFVTEATHKSTARTDANTGSVKKNTQAVSEFVDQLEQQKLLLGLNNEERAAEEALLRASNIAKRNGIELSAEEIERIRELTSEISEMKREQQEAVDAAREAQRAQEEWARRMAEPFENAFEGVQDVITDSFEGVFDGSINSADDAADAIKGIFYRMAAELATLELLNATGLTGSFAQAAGGVSAPGGSTTGASAGGFSLSDLSSASSLFDFGDGGGLLSGLTNTLDQVGFDLFGIGQQVSGPFTGAAPFTEGITGGAGSNLAGSFTLANAGAGLAGSLAADFLGLSGEYSGIGSTAGTLIAGALGAGPLGIALAAFGGSALGGLFGGGRAHPASNAGAAGFDASGLLQGVELSSKHTGTETASALVDAVNQVGQFLNAAGADLSVVESLQTGVDDGTGFFNLGANFKTETNDALITRFNPDDEAGADTALGEFSQKLVLHADNINNQLDDKTRELIESVLTHTADEAGELIGRTSQDILGDLGFILGFEDMFREAEEPLSAVEQSMNALNSQFDMMVETSERLGFSLEDIARIEAERTEGLDNLLSGYNQAIAEEIAEIVAPGTAATKAEIARYKQQLDDLQTLGATEADMQRAERLHTLRMNELLQQNGGIQADALAAEQERLSLAEQSAQTLSSQLASLDEFIYELDYGRFTLSNPTQNAAELKQLITDLDAKALLGDEDARAQLLNIAPAYLELVGEQKRFNDEYADEQRFVRDIMERQRDAASRQLDAQSRQIELSELQLETLESGFASLLEGGNLADEIAAINATSLTQAARDAFSSANPNEIVVDNREAIEAAGLLDSVKAILTSLSPGVAAGDGRRSLFFETNDTYASRASEIFRAMGIPGFAKGGAFGSGLAMVGEEGMPELVQFNGAGRVYSGRDTRSMLATAGNDNSTIQNEIKGLRGDLKAMTMAMMQSGSVGFEAVNRLDKRMQKIEQMGVLDTVSRAAV